MTYYTLDGYTYSGITLEQVLALREGVETEFITKEQYESPEFWAQAEI